LWPRGIVTTIVTTYRQSYWYLFSNVHRIRHLIILISKGQTSFFVLITSIILSKQLNAYRRRRMFVLGTVAIFLALVMTAKRENDVRFVSNDLENARPQDVWEYVSDFSNMMKLNPTMWVRCGHDIVIICSVLQYNTIIVDIFVSIKCTWVPSTYLG